MHRSLSAPWRPAHIPLLLALAAVALLLFANATGLAAALEAPRFRPGLGTPPKSAQGSPAEPGAGFSAKAMPTPPRDGATPSRDGELAAADGLLPASTTVFDRTLPGVARLDRRLLDALRRAAAAAAREDVAIHVDSGWRSRAYQERLFSEALAETGSVDAAARRVALPGTSLHEAGRAVDIGPAEAARWLASHGAAYGLCQVYRNEPWHFELRASAARSGCPAMYADTSEDPRLQP
ncbi:MAG: D-alanyl-D-alanine carboxypeptidase family protein [Chloroflexota bacterium]